eukprot:31119-Pelagococcus_subviridis.AAC.5
MHSHEDLSHRLQHVATLARLDALLVVHHLACECRTDSLTQSAANLQHLGAKGAHPVQLVDDLVERQPPDQWLVVERRERRRLRALPALSPPERREARQDNSTRHAVRCRRVDVLLVGSRLQMVTRRRTREFLRHVHVQLVRGARADARGAHVLRQRLDDVTLELLLLR